MSLKTLLCEVWDVDVTSMPLLSPLSEPCHLEYDLDHNCSDICEGDSDLESDYESELEALESDIELESDFEHEDDLTRPKAPEPQADMDLDDLDFVAPLSPRSPLLDRV